MLQDDDSWSYTDDPSDKNVDFADIETSEGIERLDKFSNVAEDSERFQISSFAATLMINHTLAAVGKDDELISTSGFANLKKRVRSKAKRNHERKCRRLRVFKFDGKQSKNAVGKGRFKKKTNITVIQEPEPQYVDHFSCRDNGLNVGTGLWSVIEDTDSVETVEAIGCDGCSVNTSPKVGAIQFVESQLGRPVQYIVCLYHFIELPIRHLFEHLDGENNFGPIGESMISIVEL